MAKVSCFRRYPKLAKFVFAALVSLVALVLSELVLRGKDHVVEWDKRKHELRCYVTSTGVRTVVLMWSFREVGAKTVPMWRTSSKPSTERTPFAAHGLLFEYIDIGWQNLCNLIRSGFNNILGQPDGELHRRLSKLALVYKGDAWKPFTYGQMAWALHVAAMHGISLIFYGENSLAGVRRIGEVQAPA